MSDGVVGDAIKALESSGLMPKGKVVADVILCNGIMYLDCCSLRNLGAAIPVPGDAVTFAYDEGVVRLVPHLSDEFFSLCGPVESKVLWERESS